MLSVSTLPADLLVDHGDRLVEIPGIVRKIYATTEMGTFLAYALEPDCILGWNRGLSPELGFAVQPQYHALPTLGTWDETYQTMRVSDLQLLAPDLIIHYAPADEINRQLADEVQEMLGVPTVLLDNSLTSLPDALCLLGRLLGKELRTCAGHLCAKPPGEAGQLSGPAQQLPAHPGAHRLPTGAGPL